MKKFKVTVTRTVEYEVEVDETVYTDEARKGWEGTFWTLDQDDNAEAFACALAEQSVRLGVNEFIEGFARVMQVKDPNLIASMSGHSEGSRAFARYRKIDDEMKKELVNLLD